MVRVNGATYPSRFILSMEKKLRMINPVVDPGGRLVALELRPNRAIVTRAAITVLHTVCSAWCFFCRENLLHACRSLDGSHLSTRDHCRCELPNAIFNLSSLARETVLFSDEALIVDKYSQTDRVQHSFQPARTMVILAKARWSQLAVEIVNSFPWTRSRDRRVSGRGRASATGNKSSGV